MTPKSLLTANYAVLAQHTLQLQPKSITKTNYFEVKTYKTPKCV